MTHMKEYNGHRSWNAWNVSLWIGSDEDLYIDAICLLQRFDLDRAAAVFVMEHPERTPDGGIYTHLAVKLAMEELT